MCSVHEKCGCGFVCEGGSEQEEVARRQTTYAIERISGSSEIRETSREQHADRERQGDRGTTRSAIRGSTSAQRVLYGCSVDRPLQPFE